LKQLTPSKIYTPAKNKADKVMAEHRGRRVGEREEQSGRKYEMS
jgi:hypothetical protein